MDFDEELDTLIRRIGQTRATAAVVAGWRGADEAYKAYEDACDALRAYVQDNYDKKEN